MKHTIMYNNETLLKLDRNTSSIFENCPTLSAYDESLIDLIGFWVQGVLLCCVALVGIKGNSFTIFMIYRQEDKNTFTLLLMLGNLQGRIRCLLNPFTDQIISQHGKKDGGSRKNNQPPHLQVFFTLIKQSAPTCLIRGSDS